MENKTQGKWQDFSLSQFIVTIRIQVSHIIWLLLGLQSSLILPPCPGKKWKIKCITLNHMKYRFYT